MFKLEVPSLTVGTLDNLMVSSLWKYRSLKLRLLLMLVVQTLSDDLVKMDSVIESVVRKVEKTGVEFLGKKASDLTVGGVPAARYIQQFAWDFAKYPNRRPLKELVSLISGGVTAIDEELKQLGSAYADKIASVQDAQRRKGGSLLVCDLNDVLTEDVMRNVTIHDTEYLKTVFIAVPKGTDKFKESVYKLGSKIVGYGGPDWSSDPTKLGEPVNFGSQVDRHQKRGSPVVPGSLQQVHSDNESVLYAVTILKGQYEAGYYEDDEFQQGTKIDFVPAFEKACRDKRFVVRDFKYDPSQASKSAMALEQLQVEVDGMRSGLMRWCKTHFGETFVAWMHIKVIRVFVESVLRYGLPVDFTAVLYKVKPAKDQFLTDALDEALSTGEKVDDDDDMDYHDFVLIKFDI